MKTILLMLCITLFCNANATNYYFSSTGGDDSRSNVQAQNPSTPWRSISKLNSIFPSLLPGDSVLFKRGDVFYGTISVTQSGSANKPIVLSAYGTGANPSISGLTSLTNWVSRGSGLYEAVLSTPPSKQLTMLLFDGAPQPYGRYPKVGQGRSSYFYISTPDPITSTTTINSNGISGIPSFVGGELVQKKAQWVIDRSVITSQSSNTIVSNPYVSPDHPRATYPSIYNHGFYFQNHVNACTKLGDWCYDNATKKVIMYFGASNPMDYSIQVAALDALVDINTRNYITLTGLTISGANETLIKLRDVTNLTINNCDISFSGNNGIGVDRSTWNVNTNHNAITNSHIHDILNNGIDAVGSVYWKVASNYIHDIGMFSGMGSNGDAQYIAVFNVGSNSVVELNKIENIGYHGIYFSGDNTIIRKNEVKNFVAVKSDGGGIYTYEASGVNRVVENNICHDGAGDHYGINIDETNPYSGQVHGIYMDGNTANVTIRNNTCFNNSRSGIWLGTNTNVSVFNNTLYNNTVGQICGHDSKGSFSNMAIRNNIMFSVAQEQLCLSIILGSNYYSTQFSIDSNFYCRPVSEIQGINTIGYPNNSLVNYPGGGIVEGYDRRFYSLDTWQKTFGVDKNTKKTPISFTDMSLLRFEYNSTNTTKTIALDATYIDVKGQSYSGSLSLAPYTSIILLKTDGNTVTPTVDYQPIPGRVEAESFSAKQWVNLESCSEGGQDASGFGQGSWMDYNVDVASAGTYTFNFRIAGWGGQLQIQSAGGTVLSTVNVPSTTGWQNWKTISSTVNLQAGTQTLRVFITTGGFNLNWFEGLGNGTVLQSQVINFPSIPNKITTDPAFALNATASSGLPVTYKIVSGPATISGSTLTLSGTTGTVTVEASQGGNSTYSAATPVRRSFSVNTASLLSQTISFPSIADKTSTDADFSLSATSTSGLPVTYKIVSGPATISGNTVSLNGTAGTVTIEASQSGNSTYDAANPVTQSFTVNAPLSLSPGYMPIPGRVEAENYSAMQWVLLEACLEGGQDATAFGQGSWMEYKVDVASAGAYTLNFRVGGWGGKLLVKDAYGNTLGTLSVPSSFGWQKFQTVGLKVNLPAGQQVLRIQIAEGGFNINWFEGLAGTVQQSQTITFPDIQDKYTTDPAFALNATASSGLPVTYKIVSGPATISGSTLTLSGTTGTVTVEASQGGNSTYSAATPVRQSFTVSATTSTTVPADGYYPIPGKMEAESYSDQQWVLLEPCLEGGKDATAFGQGSWMDYKVNVASAGAYTLNFRVGGWGGRLQVRNGDGSILNTMVVPSSYGWQKFQTVGVSVSLPAGQQVLRIYIVEGGFNINWFEGVSNNTNQFAASSAPKSVASPTVEADDQSSTVLNLYPVPVKSELTLQLDTKYTGDVRVQVLDASGRMHKAFRFQKDGAQLVQRLAVGALTPGVYMLQVTMKDKTLARSFIKQ